MSGNTATYFKNGTQVATGTLGVSTKTYTVWTQLNRSHTDPSGDSFWINFGQDSSFAGEKTSGAAGSDFYYAPPTGYKALNNSNLPDPSIADPTDYFNTTLYTGDGTTAKSVNVGMSPDFVWVKNRSATSHHSLVDRVRGDVALNSNQSIAEYSVADFNMNTDNTIDVPVYANEYSMNTSSNNYVAWNWKAGGTASSNSDGSITSSVSANPTAGFSILTYTGNNTAGATIGHGLSSVPELIITKGRTASASAHSDDWFVYAESQGANAALKLNSSAVPVTSATIYWNNTSPTSSVFSVSNDTVTNENSRGYVALCFHSVEGYSKIGYYTGNGSTDGTFVYTGFKPEFVLVKCFSAGEHWNIPVNTPKHNGIANTLSPNLTNAERAMDQNPAYDYLSNGFKFRTSDGNVNGSSKTYIYLAIAESPFKTSNAR